MKKLNKELFKNQRFLLVFDLDGTLLNSKETISPLTKSLLFELKGLGNIITIASGRPERAIKPYFDELGLTGPFICCNGALVVNPDEKGFRPLKKMIKNEFVHRFFGKFPEHLFSNFMIEDEDTQYYLRYNEEYKFFFCPEGIKHAYGSVFETIHNDVLSMVIELKDLNMSHQIQDWIESEYDGLSIRFWDDAPRFGEIFHYSVNKSTGIDYISQQYHLDRQHVICFGDAMNDIEMIKRAGISFAMKNGAYGIKEAASYVTPYTNDEEGIYYALLDLFGKEE